ncbi:MAG: hypothetical protein Q7T20_06190 [Saprospiraceae bacterium]|nr:hypothetical protein [Saprospiraceae bacterium]
MQTFELGGGAVFRSRMQMKSNELPYSIGAAVHHAGGSREVSFLRINASRAPRFTVHGALTLPVSNHYMTRTVLYLNLLGRAEIESGLRRGTVGVIAQYSAAHLGLLYQYNRQPYSGIVYGAIGSRKNVRQLSQF